MSIDATLISKNFFPFSFNQSRLIEYKFTIPSVAVSTTSSIFRFPLDFSGKIQGIRVASSSTNYDLSLRLVDGAVQNTVDEIFKVLGINLSDIRSNIDSVFDTEAVKLLNKINNPKAPGYQFNIDPNLPDIVGSINNDGVRNFIRRNDGLLFPIVQSGGTSALEITNAQNPLNNRIFFILRYEGDRLVLLEDGSNLPIISELNDTTSVVSIYKNVSRSSSLYAEIKNNDAINATGIITFVLQIARGF